MPKRRRQAGRRLPTTAAQQLCYQISRHWLQTLKNKLQRCL